MAAAAKVDAKLRHLLRRAARAVHEADAVLFTSGAGLGVDSGLPDFRGKDGFWRAYPPMKHLGLTFPEMSTPSWFYRRPELAWGFWGHRFDLYGRTQPHPGYEIMLRWGREKERRGRGGFFVFTSNVDGAFVRAGFPEERLVECHGAVTSMQCRRPCRRGELWSSEGVRVEYDPATFLATGAVPECPRCGEVARPNVMMFGDGAFDSARLSAQDARFDEWVEALPHKFVVLEIGAGTAVPTVRQLGEGLTRQSGAGTLVRVNPLDTRVPRPGTDASLAMGGLAALRALDDLLKDPQELYRS